MSLEIVRGTIKNTSAIEVLIEALRKIVTDGTFYIGYPIIASADSSHTIEALLIAQEYGLIVFNCPDKDTPFESIKDSQDQIFYLIEGNLKKHETLRKGRLLAFSPNVISFYPTATIPFSHEESEYKFATQDTLHEVLSQCPPIEKNYFRPLCAAIQRVTAIKPIKKRDNVKKTDSKGAILKKIEREIANLDQHQKKAAIEVPDGPQRVRGLAGSGKTIVLALKAAYLHTQHPDWNIVVTFHTRSLSQQFQELIERFTLEHSGNKPNWDRLRILHAWGVYSNVADALNVLPINYASAKSKYGAAGAFEGICNEIIPHIKSNHLFDPIYDAILIDEAQDLPTSFFHIALCATKHPKRIVWAYDELQNLTNKVMPSVEQLFGKDQSGNALISITNNENEPQQDIILPVCYRNTPQALIIAHALGFGIYRADGLVQLFDALELWKEIGYTVTSGELQFDSKVTLKRKNDSFPAYFPKLIPPGDAVVAHQFGNIIDQYEWIANAIQQNISEEELDPDDILVIFPNAYTARQQFLAFNQSLIKRGINAHLAGVSTDLDTFTQINSITAASIYRAKGNEAPMVYIVNADWCAYGLEMIKLRNILFTAITRSRAWVRICGIGTGMQIIKDEIDMVKTKEYQLEFNVPTREELRSIRLINRDRTAGEKGKITKAIKNIHEISDLISSGVITPEMIPELQNLIELAKRSNASGNDFDEE